MKAYDRSWPKMLLERRESACSCFYFAGTRRDFIEDKVRWPCPGALGVWDNDDDGTGR